MYLGWQYLRAYPEIKGAVALELVTEPAIITGRKELKSLSFPVASSGLENQDTVSLVLDLHGLCVLPAEGAALKFFSSSGAEYAVALKDYVADCLDGVQQSIIPLSAFFPVSIPPDINNLSLQFWYPTTYVVDVTSLSIYNRVLGAKTTVGKPLTSKTPAVSRKNKFPTPSPSVSSAPSPSPIAELISPLPTATPLSAPTLSPSPSPVLASTAGWGIRGVSSMKETKDRLCGPRDSTYISQWVDRAASLGVTHIAVETPYDSPACGDAVAHTKVWVDTIHTKGLNVWHRHMPLAFEGIYDTPKNPSADYLAQISAYIRANPGFFRTGDIFTPTPEPQNGGIRGVTYCSGGICIFSSKEHFNAWLRDAMTVSSQAFDSIGMSGMRVGYWGFDGFVAWGDNNPDWNGILEDSTVTQMGNITIDHYPEIVGDTMSNDLNELQLRYPNIPIIIGEWGTITGTGYEAQVLQSMSAAARPGVSGFGYWHMGVGGNESLVDSALNPLPHFDEVQSFFTQ